MICLFFWMRLLIDHYLWLIFLKEPDCNFLKNHNKTQRSKSPNHADLIMQMLLSWTPKTWRTNLKANSQWANVSAASKLSKLLNHISFDSVNLLSQDFESQSLMWGSQGIEWNIATWTKETKPETEQTKQNKTREKTLQRNIMDLHAPAIHGDPQQKSMRCFWGGNLAKPQSCSMLKNSVCLRLRCDRTELVTVTNPRSANSAWLFGRTVLGEIALRCPPSRSKPWIRLVNMVWFIETTLEMPADNVRLVVAQLKGDWKWACP